MRPLGASSSVVLTGHPTASPETRQRLRPLSFAANRTGAKKGDTKDEETVNGCRDWRDSVIGMREH